MLVWKNLTGPLNEERVASFLKCARQKGGVFKKVFKRGKGTRPRPLINRYKCHALNASNGFNRFMSLFLQTEEMGGAFFCLLCLLSRVQTGFFLCAEFEMHKHLYNLLRTTMSWLPDRFLSCLY